MMISAYYYAQGHKFKLSQNLELSQEIELYSHTADKKKQNKKQVSVNFPHAFLGFQIIYTLSGPFKETHSTTSTLTMNM